MLDETAFLLSLLVRKPIGRTVLSPAMALASLFTSPLMPWDATTGNDLAQKVSEGNFTPELPDEANENCRKMLELVRKRTTNAAALADALPRFVRLLRQLPDYDNPLCRHRKRAEEIAKKAAAQVSSLKGALTDDNWNSLLRTCLPQSMPGDVPVNKITREGIAIFQEGDEPWRRVKRLFVLGCFEGHYPNAGSRSSVFFNADFAALRDICRLQIETPDERSRRRRDLFRRQLCTASGDVMFLIPRRDRMGKPLAPSHSIAFMASLIPGEKPDTCIDIDKLVIDLEGCDPGKVKGVKFAAEQNADTPWQPVTDDLELETDLVALRTSAESPSRLETLMISPLAWLLDRMKISPREWQPEQLDMGTKGKLLHRVYELLFAYGTPIPVEDKIISRVPELLDMAVEEICPYLQGPEWSVEREHLKQDIITSTKRWGEILTELGATVVGNEVSLQGTLSFSSQGDLPIHGNADLLLELSDGRLLVVDYKTSTSTDRRLRMKSGYDHQATLYSTMIKTGGPEYPEKLKPEVVQKLQQYKEKGEIRALYYLTLDQQILTDSSGWLPTDFAGQPEMGDGISREALPFIEERIGQTRRGKVALNRDGYEDEFKKNRGITAKYALESSPLVKTYLKNSTNV